MAPKKTQRSALWYYAQECMRNGTCNAGTIREAIDEVYTNWQALSTSEKMPYATKYEQWKKEIKVSVNNAFQIAPNLVKDELMANQSSNQFENNKNNRMLKIQNFVTNLFPIKNNQTNIELNSSEYDKLKSHKFYLIKFATLAKCDKFTDENLKYDYSPYYVLAEVSIAEYSLVDGLKNEYHAFIQPNKIPLGYRSTCMETSRDHLGNIPLDHFDQVKKSHVEIYMDIQNFLNLTDNNNNTDNNYHSTVFCMDKDLDETRFGLKFLFDRTLEKGLEIEPLMVANVYDLENLMNEIGKIRISGYNAAKIALSSTAFDYCFYTRCAYHEELNVIECSLNIVKKQCYILSDNLCQLFNIYMTNNHLPVQESVGTVVVSSNFGSKYKNSYRNNQNNSFSNSQRNLTSNTNTTTTNSTTNSMKSLHEEDDDEYIGSDASYPVKRHPQQQTVIYPSQDIRLKESIERSSTVGSSMNSFSKQSRFEDLRKLNNTSRSIPNGLNEDTENEGWTMKSVMSNINLEQEVKSNISNVSENSSLTDNTSVVSGTSSKTSNKLYLGRGKPIKRN